MFFQPKLSYFVLSNEPLQNGSALTRTYPFCDLRSQSIHKGIDSENGGSAQHRGEFHIVQDDNMITVDTRLF